MTKEDRAQWDAERYERFRTANLCRRCQKAGSFPYCRTCAAARRAINRRYKVNRRARNQALIQAMASSVVPRVTVIAGYVPPKGSIALQFLGNVIQPH